MMGVIIVIMILVLLTILVLKMTTKYHITWHWCQDIRDSYMVEKGPTNLGEALPPLFGQCPKENVFFPCEVFLNLAHVLHCCCVFSSFVLHQNADCVTICLAAFWGEAGRSEAAGALLFLFCRVFLFLPFFGLRFQFDAHVIVHPSILFIPVPYSL